MKTVADDFLAKDLPLGVLVLLTCDELRYWTLREQLFIAKVYYLALPIMPKINPVEDGKAHGETRMHASMVSRFLAFNGWKTPRYLIPLRCFNMSPERTMHIVMCVVVACQSLFALHQYQPIFNFLQLQSGRQT